MSREARFFANQEAIQQDKMNLANARFAVERFRYPGRISLFPYLRDHLKRVNRAFADLYGDHFHSFDLSGFGIPDRWHLTAEEYAEMEKAYNDLNPAE